jgi:hypothetical protein
MVNNLSPTTDNTEKPRLAAFKAEDNIANLLDKAKALDKPTIAPVAAINTSRFLTKVKVREVIAAVVRKVESSALSSVATLSLLVLDTSWLLLANSLLTCKSCW